MRFRICTSRAHAHSLALQNLCPARRHVAPVIKTFKILCLVLLIACSTEISAQTASDNYRFAVIGDYGKAGTPERDVANRIKSWNPDFIITVGDNNYSYGEATTIDRNIGQYFHDYIHPYNGSYGAGAIVNRFFPVLGNHDWGNKFPNPSAAQPYLDYFQLPGNERYYDFVKGSAHFFALDSDPNEPDGYTATSVQALWLRDKLAAATERWKIVYLHHSPYSSGEHGGLTDLRWAFKEWGASIVIAGHEHDYERLLVNGLPYIVNGLGGATIRNFGIIDPNSQIRYNADYGAMLVDVTPDKLTFQFITRTGIVIDTYTLNAPAPIRDLTLSPNIVNGGATSLATMTLNEPAPTGGLVVGLATSNANAASVPPSITVAEGTNSKTFEVLTQTVTTETNVTISATSANQTKPATLTVRPAVPASTLVSLSLSPSSGVTGNCQSASGKVTLSAKAPAGGVNITLTSGNAAAASVPSIVAVPAGATYINFPITTISPTSKQTSTITASLNGASFYKTLTVYPVGVGSLALTPNPVTGGNTVSGTVTLNCIAQPGDVEVKLTTTNSGIARPSVSTLIIPAGTTTATFTITTFSAVTTRHATINASANGISRRVQLTVVP